MWQCSDVNWIASENKDPSFTPAMKSEYSKALGAGKEMAGRHIAEGLRANHE